MKYKYNTSYSYKGKRFSVRANTLKELNEKRLRKIEQIENELCTDVTVKQWAYRCIELYKTNQAEITKKKYIARVKHTIIDEIGTLYLSQVKSFQLQEVLNLQQGKSQAQINEVYNALRFIFRKAYENDLIKKDISISLVKPKGTKAYRRALTDFEREIFIKVASRERRFYGFLLMLYCGCRPSEAMSCKGEDITKIDAVNVLHIKGKKTAFSDRFVPIPDNLYDLIKSTAKTQNIALYDSSKPITYDNRSRLWRSLWRKMNIEAGTSTYRNKLVEPYKIPKDLTPYCLRHDYCTSLAKKNIDIRIAQKLMGHSTINLTANIYTHVDNIVAVSQVAKML